VKRLRDAAAWLAGHVDRRDVLGLAGLAFLYVGGERLLPGCGFAAVGLVMVAVSVLGVR
jgi:hypothetical protein